MLVTRQQQVLSLRLKGWPQVLALPHDARRKLGDPPPLVVTEPPRKKPLVYRQRHQPLALHRPHLLLLVDLLALLLVGAALHEPPVHEGALYVH